MKTCLKCGEEKSLEDFPRRGDKRRGVCRQCTYEAKNTHDDNPAFARFMAWFESLETQ